MRKVIQEEIVEHGCDNCGELIKGRFNKITLDGYFTAENSWETGEEFCKVSCLVEWIEKKKDKLNEEFSDIYRYNICLNGNQMIDLAKVIICGKESLDE